MGCWQDRGWGFTSGTIKGHPTVSPRKSSKALIRAVHHLVSGYRGCRDLCGVLREQAVTTSWLFSRFVLRSTLHSMRGNVYQIHQHTLQNLASVLGGGGLGSVTTSRSVVLASPWTKYELAESWVRKRHFSQHIENCSSSLRNERSTYSEIDV